MGNMCYNKARRRGEVAFAQQRRRPPKCKMKEKFSVGKALSLFVPKLGYTWGLVSNKTKTHDWEKIGANYWVPPGQIWERATQVKPELTWAPPILWKWKANMRGTHPGVSERAGVNKRHSKQETADYFRRLRKCRSGIYVLLFADISAM